MNRCKKRHIAKSSSQQLLTKRLQTKVKILMGNPQQHELTNSTSETHDEKQNNTPQYIHIHSLLQFTTLVSEIHISRRSHVTKTWLDKHSITISYPKRQDHKLHTKKTYLGPLLLSIALVSWPA